MATAQQERPPGTDDPETVAVAKKKGEANDRQVNVRFTHSIHERLRAVSEALGIDIAQLVRSFVHKQLPHAEREAEEIRRAEAKD